MDTPVEPEGSGGSAKRPGRALTIAEWAAMDEDEPGERVHGHLEEAEVPDAIHEVPDAWLIGKLGHLLEGKASLIGGTEAKFVVAPRRRRNPDLFVYLPSSPLPPGRGPISVPPDIMVEVVTPTARDERRDRV